jgi:hypothetical protein
MDHLLRFIEAPPLQVKGFGEQAGEGAAMPTFAHGAECHTLPASSAPPRLGRRGQLDVTGRVGVAG